MKLINYSLRVKKELLTNVNIEFRQGQVTHILGQNGTGKSCFAKSILGRFKYTGNIEIDNSKMVLIGSYSNIPLSFKVKDILNIVKRSYGNNIVTELYDKLGIERITMNSTLKSLSDGQKQKIKLFFYLASSPDVIILDEFTNALDKETCKEVYLFFSEYVKEKNNCVILNITHNLSDLEYMKGEYFLIQDKKLKKISTKEEMIKLYIEGV